jgi:inorganic pyrophosphatase
MDRQALPEVDWRLWERLIKDLGITLDRPRGSTHPVHESIRYPIDYGYINGTTASDGDEVDIFVGTKENGLVAAIFTIDFRKKDRELKLIYNCSPLEVYLVNGFVNFDQALMNGALVMRHPMSELWEDDDHG